MYNANNIQCPPGTISYVIRGGDTYYNLAQRYNTSIPALVSANPFVDPNRLMIGQSICIPRQQIYPACPEGNYYTIKQGDTLSAIALFFNVSLDDLIEANPAIDPDRLAVGQIICIPLATPPVQCPPNTTEYTVERGDTFYRIARRYNITVEALAESNPRINPYALLIGQKLCIPNSQ
ncbi:LysM domain-containing protein [Geosporobacter subterraneus DSM 17957]|uniref:LysM domain-containing protein n=1 Tax=Geosporobacter subterraneus DSM 17957 TaxID=1121919 RepID=A0A1M6IHP8_9FIRM|nr:LysM domain-containing protein [Geosporobacter subterraneus]SHJ33943.1 LysM domain-containing protein [Geosporobacter subterraneus DSM 17957]